MSEFKVGDRAVYVGATFGDDTAFWQQGKIVTLRDPVIWSGRTAPAGWYAEGSTTWVDNKYLAPFVESTDPFDLLREAVIKVREAGHTVEVKVTRTIVEEF